MTARHQHYTSMARFFIARFFWILMLLLTPAAALAQPAAEGRPQPLNGYVQQALESNLALEQRVIDLRRSEAALREARGAWLPALSVEARYSRAEGGRNINLPLGDLLNPVYSTLNDLTAAQGQPAGFPSIDNQQIPLVRDQEQETILRLEQPVFQPQIRAGVRARRAERAAQGAAVDAYRRTLVRDVKTAYFAYLQAARGVAIFEAAEELTREALRTNEGLRAVSRVTPDVVLRARAEVLEVEQQTAEARKDRDLARSYFNFLLNRPLEAFIERPAGDPFAEVAPATLQRVAADETDEVAGLQDRATEHRPELEQLAAAARAATAGAAAARSAFFPVVSLALDAGIQGERYGFTGEQPFYLGSVVLRWNLFNGFQDQARVEQRELEAQRLRTQREETRQQIRLEVQQAVDQIRVARQSLRAAAERAAAAREGFRLTARRYDENLVNQVTLLDARTTRTRADLNLNITRYNLLIRLAELEFAAGFSTIDSNEQP